MEEKMDRWVDGWIKLSLKVLVQLQNWGEHH